MRPRSTPLRGIETDSRDNYLRRRTPFETTSAVHDRGIRSQPQPKLKPINSSAQAAALKQAIGDTLETKAEVHRFCNESTNQYNGNQGWQSGDLANLLL
jgi:hypothetical protein